MTQIATGEMINTAVQMITTSKPSRSFLNFSIRLAHGATEVQADDAIRAARLSLKANTDWLRI